MYLANILEFWIIMYIIYINSLFNISFESVTLSCTNKIPLQTISIALEIYTCTWSIQFSSNRISMKLCRDASHLLLFLYYSCLCTIWPYHSYLLKKSLVLTCTIILHAYSWYQSIEKLLEIMHWTKIDISYMFCFQNVTFPRVSNT